MNIINNFLPLEFSRTLYEHCMCSINLTMHFKFRCILQVRSDEEMVPERLYSKVVIKVGIFAECIIIIDFTAPYLCTR